MLSDLVPLGEMLALGVGLATAATALLVQCADKRNAPKKAKKGGVVSKKSVRSSKKSSRSQLGSAAAPVKSTRSSKKSSRSQRGKAVGSVKSKRSSRSQKKQRVSSRSSSKKSSAAIAVPQPVEKTSEKAEAGKRSAAPHEVTARSKREKDSSLKSLQETQGVTARSKRERDPSFKSLQETQAVTARSKRENEPSLKSVQETQKVDHPFESVQAGPVRELQMEPRELHFDKQGGLLKVQLLNPSSVRQAIKVKCSDNNLYRVNPVFGYVEPGQQLDVEVVRQSGTSKLDKIVFVSAKASDANKDLKQLFKEAPREQQQMMVLPLWA